MKKYRIALMPGDGIGPEICESTRQVTEEVVHHLAQESLEWVNLPIGWEAIQQKKPPLPQETLDELEACDGWVLGPHDSASYPEQYRQSLNPSGAIRKHFDLYANIRPARSVSSNSYSKKAFDLVIVRENTEGFYADRNMHLGTGEFMPHPDTALAVGVFTRKACERIARSAFELAMNRNKKISIIHKANVLRLTYGLFLESCRKVSADFPEVAVNDFHIDAAAALLVRNPDEFDVIVTTNMFGDILSDLASELAGSLGMGAALNAGTRKAMAQAAHGSAPSLSGKNVANPCGLMLSAGMLLQWLSRRDQNPPLLKASVALEKAIYQTLETRGQTQDLGGTLGTKELTDAILLQLREDQQ